MHFISRCINLLMEEMKEEKEELDQHQSSQEKADDDAIVSFPTQQIVIKSEPLSVETSSDCVDSEQRQEHDSLPELLDCDKAEISEIVLMKDNMLKPIPLSGTVETQPCVTDESSSTGIIHEESSSNRDKSLYKLEIWSFSKYYKAVKDVQNGNAMKYQWLCTKCDQASSSLNKLKEHFKEDHLSDLLFCDLCKMLFPEESGLKYHMRCYHQPYKQWKCRRCNFSTTQYRQYRTHEKRHIKSVQCDKCDQKLKNKYSLQRHMQRKHSDQDVNNPTKTFKCNICNTAFFEAGHLDNHMRSKHLAIRPYACSMCNFRSSYKRNLTVHTKRWHLNSTKLICPHCKKKFHDENLLKEHEKIHLVHWCPLCPFKASSLVKLAKHRSEKHIEIGMVKPLQCDKCFAQFSSYVTLKRHVDKICLLTQGDQKSFQCDKCHSRFTSLSSMTQHIAKYCPAIHYNDVSRPLQCDVCFSRYDSMKVLRKHKDMLHKQTLSQDLACSNCHQTFPDKCRLEDHVRQSICCKKISKATKKAGKKTEVKIYQNDLKCHACNEQFSKLKVLKRHLAFCVFK